MASRFTPSGVFPQGFAPLAQPFATNPAEYALWGHPQHSYYSSYAQPAFARAQPGLYPHGYPQASVYPQMFPADMPPPVPAVEPNPVLSSAAILESLQRDGTFDQLTSGERANFLLQLAALQQSEIGQRIAQAGLQQNSQANVLNMRRVPLDLSVAYQSNARDWFESYVFYASTIQNLISTACNNTTGILGTGVFGGGGPGITAATGPGGAPLAAVNGNVTGTGLGNITNVAALCRATNRNLPICLGIR
jgi:hypothetical protein